MDEIDAPDPAADSSERSQVLEFGYAAGDVAQPTHRDLTDGTGPAPVETEHRDLADPIRLGEMFCQKLHALFAATGACRWVSRREQPETLDHRSLDWAG